MAPGGGGQPAARRAALQAALVRGLPSCSTEADIVQLLYAQLHPTYGYDPINLHVLEREGWYHSRAVDRGLLQDVRRRRLSESIFASNYSKPRTLVTYPKPHLLPTEEGRGPGVDQIPLTVIWMPISHQDQVIGAVIYQLYVRREVPREELALLEEVHAHLGVVVANAYLNELTRNQAMSLSALNQIARALSATRDEHGIMTALRSTLGPLIPVDELELVAPEASRPEQLRGLRMVAETPIQDQVQATSNKFASAKEVLSGGRSMLGTPDGRRRPYASEAWVPVKEGASVRAALAVRSRRADAYEQSTLIFLQQVADQVGLALRHAWSYAALEAQRQHLEITNRMLEDHRRRLEVVDAVGRRLASCLDRRSIMRTLQRELSRHLEFDVFTLATVTETPQGPQAEGYVDDSGRERALATLQLSAAGPARQAYETGRPVLIQDSPWADTLESKRRGKGTRVFGEGVVLDVTRPDDRGPVATRSILWVPVRQGNRTTALISLQAYRAGIFSQWHLQLVQDVAAHVSLALSTAEHFRLAEIERRRLEALHLLETGAAGATEERQVAEAGFKAIHGAMRTSNLVLVYLGGEGQVTGYGSEAGGPIDPLAPKPADQTHFFRRLLEEGKSIAEGTPPDQRQQRPGLGWPSRDHRMPAQVIWVPVRQGDRVVGALSAQRYEDVPFSREEVELLESAAPVVGIALRTVRLHRANELALRHSVRIQEVAALAGHDLQSVVSSVAEQARTMLVAAGAACWALAEDGRIAAQATAGDGIASRVLTWSGLGGRHRQGDHPQPIIGRQRKRTWSLVPLYYADHLVGALGFVQAQAALDESIEAPTDFARHAAIAIENARLAAETRGRIHTLEAVAAFADLDIARPSRARAEMGRLVEWALAGSRGALWLLESGEMVRAPGEDPADRLQVPYPHDRTSRGRAANVRAFRAVLRSQQDSGVITSPIVLEGQLVGMLSAEEGSTSSAETRRLMIVVASQAALVLRRLRLVAALNSQARTMAAILKHSPVGVVLEDSAGRILYANPVIERIYAVPAGSLLGAAAEQLPSRAGASLVVDPEARPGAPAELRIGERIVQLRRVAIPSSDDQGAGVLTLHEDITEEKASLDAKELMLRAIGHEVRSPAAAMRATIASLLQWEQVMDPGQRHDLMEKAYEQSERLLDLVEAQLTIAKLEGGGFEPKPVEVSISETLEQVRQVLGSRYGPRVDAVSYRLPAKLGNASCEPAHLEQALTNLIGNGLEHSWATRIVVTARDEGDWLEVSVEDNGRGLPRDRMDVLFSRPAAAGQHRARGGLGLGLYLCRLIVERSFGGRIWLEKTGPGCSIFKFTLPAAGRRPRRRGARTAHGRSEQGSPS
jgi:signal transduction histidine kinase